MPSQYKQCNTLSHEYSYTCHAFQHWWWLRSPGVVFCDASSLMRWTWWRPLCLQRRHAWPARQARRAWLLSESLWRWQSASWYTEPGKMSHWQSSQRCRWWKSSGWTWPWSWSLCPDAPAWEQKACTSFQTMKKIWYESRERPSTRVIA